MKILPKDISPGCKNIPLRSELSCLVEPEAAISVMFTPATPDLPPPHNTQMEILLLPPSSPPRSTYTHDLAENTKMDIDTQSEYMDIDTPDCTSHHALHNSA